MFICLGLTGCLEICDVIKTVCYRNIADLKNTKKFTKTY